MGEISRTTFALLRNKVLPGHGPSHNGSSGMRKSYRQNWSGRQDPRLFPECVAVADAIEIQDALIFLALCYV